MMEMIVIETSHKKLDQFITEKWTLFREASAAAQIKIPDTPALIRNLQRVFIASDFFSKQCTRHPHMLKELIDSGDLERAYPADEYAKKLHAALTQIEGENELARQLRLSRRREMLRIAFRDITDMASLADTMSDLSAFADACIRQALTRLHDWQCEKLGFPADPHGAPEHLLVIGMGKLGAQELNFSSDIDLVFAYPNQGTTCKGPAPMSNEEFFTQLGRRLMSVLGQVTAEGPLFRVDMRLRPFGENGPLVMSIDNMESYYQEQGREWERYAWIKARLIAGDRSAGDLLMEHLKPFIYRRYIDYGTFDAIRDMKQMIAFEVKRKGMQNNIKLGPGGIREIEFFGQVFQLIRGGVTSFLQERKILKVLQILVSENLIAPQDRDDLSGAYAFLRTIEHRLQELDDQQTHSLPVEPITRARLAFSLGFPNWDALHLEIQRQMTTVHTHFNNLLKPLESEGSSAHGRQPGKSTEALEALWQARLETEEAQSLMHAMGYDNPAEALKVLHNFHSDPILRTYSKKGRERIDKLMPMIIKASAGLSQPALALDRITELIRSIGKRSIYISMLVENPAALPHLVKLIEASPLIASFLTRHPLLLDEFIDQRTLYHPPDLIEMQTELAHRLEQIPPDDLEHKMDTMRVFKQINTLRVAAADVTEVLPLMKVSDHLTYLAEILIHQVLELAWEHLVAKHGYPACELDHQSCTRGFAVIAYGKLGGLELSYGSDLDLVFLHAGSSGETSGGRLPIDNALFFARLGQRVIHLLSAQTAVGALYDIDMRLRPSGSSGVLVSHINSFQDYQLSDAWTWEHQALIKARPICGDLILTERFTEIRSRVLQTPADEVELQQEVKKMRHRMRQQRLKPVKNTFDIKQSPGGMIDIEFMVQYLILLYAHAHPSLTEWTDNVRLLQSLSETGLISENTADYLKKAYLVYRAAAHRLNLQNKPAQAPDDTFRSMQDQVIAIWNQLMNDSEVPIRP
jgi:glutamate-ammonia-ligase adenylyltransferase